MFIDESKPFCLRNLCGIENRNLSNAQRKTACWNVNDIFTGLGVNTQIIDNFILHLYGKTKRLIFWTEDNDTNIFFVLLIQTQRYG